MTNIGDDLIDARDFVNSTIVSMDILLSDARLNVELSQSRLREICLDARTLSAKGIARAAQSVLDCYESGCSQPKIDGRLMTLYKLVAQYAEGLDEIAPVIKRDSPAVQQDTLEAQHAKACETLIPLIKFSGDTAPALQRLTGISVGTSSKTVEPKVSFESLIPDITNSALRAARSQGKSISVSYAADGLAVIDSQVESVRGQLEDIVTRLVRTRIASPDTRASKGLSRSGHIDISATETAKGLDISVECDGEKVTLFPKAENHKIQPTEPTPSTDVSIDMSLEIGA